MLVSGVQHSHCGIHRYCFMFFSIMVYYRILNIVACAIQQDLVILYMIVLKNVNRDFAGGLVAKIPCSQYREPGFDPWLGTRSHML